MEVLDDSERWFGGDGEFSFAATVTFDDGDCRYHTRRVPASGYYDVAAGEERRLDTCVFEGYVAEDDEMERMILPTEADWPDSDDELTPFRQQFSGPPESWTGSYAPGDEPVASDTAPSTDCRLWYHVESVPL